MRKFLLTAFAVGMGVIGLGNAAHAYTVTQSTGNTTKSFDADNSGSFSSAVTGKTLTARFTYSGPLSFNVNPPQNTNSTGDLNSDFFSDGVVSNYTNLTNGNSTLPAPANADFSSRTSFLASSASNAGYGYGSLLLFNLGVLNAGTTLTIEHDDGVSVYQGGNRIGTTTAGPTAAITETVRLTNTAETLLYYSRQNGAPSVLNVTVPEPTSIALVASALFGAAFVRRRKS